MFKFNFNISEKNENQLFDNEKINSKKIESEQNELKCYDCEELFVDKNKLQNLDIYRECCTKIDINGFQINYINLKNLNKIQNITTNDIKKAEINHSDLIPGIYEGGAKIWECTEDLLQYLLENINDSFFKNKSVLDLGCGVGLLGIYAFKKGAEYICFQDYNRDVLENITIPSLLLNADFENVSFCDNNNVKNCKFYSGDWENFSKFSENEDKKYDFIFTSETIYNPENYKKILNTFDNKLKTNQDGKVFLAAKTYYFGVGGGLREFEKLITNDGRFRSEVVWTSSVSSGVPREILKIQRNIICTNTSDYD